MLLCSSRLLISIICIFNKKNLREKKISKSLFWKSISNRSSPLTTLPASLMAGIHLYKSCPWPRVPQSRLIGTSTWSSIIASILISTSLYLPLDCDLVSGLRSNKLWLEIWLVDFLERLVVRVAAGIPTPYRLLYLLYISGILSISYKR